MKYIASKYLDWLQIKYEKSDAGETECAPQANRSLEMSDNLECQTTFGLLLH